MMDLNPSLMVRSDRSVYSLRDTEPVKSCLLVLNDLIIIIIIINFI